MSTPLYQLKAEFFKTLGHPARIRVLELLCEGERSVSELQPDVGLESSHLSQQLGVLRRAGLVGSRKQGSAVFYAIASPEIAELLAVARRILSGMLHGQMAVLRDLQETSTAAGEDVRQHRREPGGGRLVGS
ncbi:MAG TPA: metalloregulator ArsR/SmtB family transcription factor [Mycobacteriales bacterium]|nr:metalloregulator ArsR/SmtB family transcription factor [Mycobacteriales bacterium]